MNFCALPSRGTIQFILAMVSLSKYKPYALLMHAEFLTPVSAQRNAGIMAVFTTHRRMSADITYSAETSASEPMAEVAC